MRARQGFRRVSAPGVHALQVLALEAIGAEPIDRLEVSIGTWRPPRGWMGAPALSGISEVRIRPQRDGVTVELRAGEPMDPGLLLAAVVRCLRPARPGEGDLVTLGTGLNASAAALVPGLLDVASTGPGNPHLRRTDTLVVAAADAYPELERRRTVVVDGCAWSVDGRVREVAVDPTVHRPVGRRSVVDGEIGAAAVDGGRLVITAGAVRIETASSLSAAEVARLRTVRGLVTPSPLPLPWRAQLEAIGIVLSESDFPDDNLGWLAQSVHARRHALRWYTPLAALDAWPTVSIVLVTHRDRFIEHAVRQLAAINYPRLQVVIGLHGVHVDRERLRPLVGLHDVVVHEIPADLSLGEAMQSACDRADGSLVTKLDDDDYYGSEHVWDLVLARMYSGAELVGKALDWIHVEAEDVTAFRPVYPAESYATFVAGGTLLISKGDLAAAGGWRPVPKSVDRALIDSVKRAGGVVYRTHGLGYLYVRHGHAHTAVVEDQHFLTKNEQQWPGLISHAVFGTERHG